MSQTIQTPAPTLWERIAGIPLRAPEGWVRRRPTAAERRNDALFGLLLAALLALSTWAGEQAGLYTAWAQTTPPWALVAFPLGYAIAVATRRSHPLAALVLATILFLGGFFAPYREMSFTQFGYFAIFYSTGAWSRNRTAAAWTRLVIAVGTVGWVTLNSIMLAAMSASGDPSADSTLPDGSQVQSGGAYALLSIVLNIAYYFAAHTLGNIDYLRTGSAALAEEQARELAAQREQLADQAVRLDRIRIARELHDAVAHHVSLMGLQAAVARRSLPAGEGRARAAAQLEQVEASARGALEELQGILATLRSDEASGAGAAVGRGGGSPGPGAEGDGAPVAEASDASAHTAGAAALAAGASSTESSSTRGVGQLPALVSRCARPKARSGSSRSGSARPSRRRRISRRTGSCRRRSRTPASTRARARRPRCAYAGSRMRSRSTSPTTGSARGRPRRRCRAEAAASRACASAPRRSADRSPPGRAPTAASACACASPPPAPGSAQVPRGSCRETAAARHPRPSPVRRRPRRRRGADSTSQQGQ
ncbi:hypothetical protein USB125703_00576 [Pseudoclavibacter triregionum]|nr:hypothetical protein USB125703_00576 [Pseudoclavibacter triregionum]